LTAARRRRSAGSIPEKTDVVVVDDTEGPADSEFAGALGRMERRPTT
jgi:hypothetical protein